MRPALRLKSTDTESQPTGAAMTSRRAAEAPAFDAWQSARVMADVAAATLASPQALEALRATRLADLLGAAARDSAFYRAMLKRSDLARVRLQDLPITHRAELMARFDDWVTDPALRLDELRRFTADPQ